MKETDSDLVLFFGTGLRHIGENLLAFLPCKKAQDLNQLEIFILNI
jgi:hypothetical protein